MKKLLFVALAAMSAIALFAGTAAASHVLWQQDFSTNTTDWERDIVHNAADGNATVGNGGALSRFGGYRSVWPGDYTAELDVYLDPAWAVGEGFEYSVASNGSDGLHQRDFVFHVAVTSTGLRVIGDNNVYGSGGNAFVANQGALIPSAGWYTMQHVFRNNGGVLAVDLQLLSGDTVIYSTTRSDAADTMDQVGGNRYAFFWTVNVAGGVDIDNQELYIATTDPLSTDDCKNGGWEEFGFSNQGQCMRFVNTGKDSRA